MKKDTATQVFESLASGIRLDVYRLLVKAGPQGMVAGQIASSLAIVPNKLSFHLKAMLWSTKTGHRVRVFPVSVF
ncbi:TPA: helix-turn-helix transcriptional regulator [Escherichia coli]|uniref:winged helix-turn-helix domain-containing protein n=1 Tax=Enterobacteriaceae TaxID=543 RepID=UPI0009834B4B|nr:MULTISPECIES: helix-turn-helix domain-containing protein [Enterobacteriaceae]EAS9754811.1 ArsR family transcriptional regulator [Salmonella enterica]EBV8843853.1 ArsR family transcriptional regulator [Salmonella enterica subsp. enterica serovar Senftenberg]ECI0404940.1 ArsR family transcriptional regulator [Salmonella enterica subsp. enterica]MBZ4749827.1 helix-turn-helix transcriptional regulator [Salmonella enterica subsp. enterica serovar Typhimurium]EAS9759101.1 ArsR family transcriptio